MSRRGPAAEALLLELGIGEYSVHERHKHSVEHPRIVATVERGFASVVAEAVKNTKRTFETLSHLPKSIGIIPISGSASIFKTKHIVRHHQKLVAVPCGEFLLKFRVKGKILLANGWIAGEHNLAVDTESVRCVQRLLGAIKTIFKRKICGKLHKDLSLRTWLQRRRQHLLTVFRECEHGESRLLAKTPHLDCLLPSLFVKPLAGGNEVGIHKAETRILKQRPIIPMVQEITAVDTILQLRPHEEIRPSGLAFIWNLRPFREKLLRIRRKLPI